MVIYISGVKSSKKKMADHERMDLDLPPAPPPPRLIQYGRYVSTRLLSNLRECQKDALDALQVLTGFGAT